MIRQDLYVTVTAAEWRAYEKAPPRSATKRVLHMDIFYSGRRRLTAAEIAAVTYTWAEWGVFKSAPTKLVLHPVLQGVIPEGHAVTECDYQNETRWTVRSERETAHTRSNAIERTL